MIICGLFVMKTLAIHRCLAWAGRLRKMRVLLNVLSYCYLDYPIIFKCLAVIMLF